MKLLVAFKVCKNLDLLDVNSVEFEEEMRVDTHFLSNQLNCYDESALELALRLKEKSDPLSSPCELTALTVGDEISELTLKTLKALGYQYTVRVPCDPEPLRFEPHIIAKTIACYALRHQHSLVLAGQEAPSGNSSSVPQMVSVMTGYPLICSVIDIISINENSVWVHISDRGGVIEQKICLPCVLAIGNAVVSKLRVPTLRARMQCKGEECTYAELEQSEPVHAAPFSLTLPLRRRAGYISQETGEAAVCDIFKSALKERLDML